MDGEILPIGAMNIRDFDLNLLLALAAQLQERHMPRAAARPGAEPARHKQRAGPAALAPRERGWLRVLAEGPPRRARLEGPGTARSSA